MTSSFDSPQSVKIGRRHAQPRSPRRSGEAQPEARPAADGRPQRHQPAFADAATGRPRNTGGARADARDVARQRTGLGPQHHDRKQSATLPAIGPDTPGSKLCVGPKIKLKGVEISDCDVLVVEGEVEATVNSKAMQIAEPGTLKGQVAIDVAEIYGEFSGELTARAKLIVHSTGRVSGTIRYGKLIVAEGGVLSGDVQRIEGNAEHLTAKPPAQESRPALAQHAAR